jgi:pimeloyl-ACP methyl ester carboxylesterase
MNAANLSANPQSQPQPPRGRVRVWFKRIVLGLLAAALLLLLAGALYQAVATAADMRTYPAPGQLVDAGGFRLHLYCLGEQAPGAPTVILENGLGATSATWARVQPEVARSARVCAYDRAGAGWSDPSRAPRDAQAMAGELHSLLQAAGIPGPYVLVGWSFGGLVVRVFAGQYPDEVAGLVLVDSSHPDQWTRSAASQARYEMLGRLYAAAPFLARIGVVRLMGLFGPDSGLPAPYGQALNASLAAAKDMDTQAAEFAAFPRTSAQVHASPVRGDLPLYVLTATKHDTLPGEEQDWQAMQSELALLSTNSVHQVVAGANHADFWRDPQTVKVTAAAILQLVPPPPAPAAATP